MRTPGALALATVLFVALAASGRPAGASATNADARARVIWVRGASLAVAAPDSFSAPGDTLLLLDRSRTIGACEVTQIVGGSLAIGTLVSGSLAGARPGRLRVRVVPASRALPVTLVVGVPAGARANLLVRCARVTPAVTAWGGDWRSLSSSARESRFARAGERAGSAGPETLVVRMFADAVDEEIALERRDLDVAVFWPGELGSRLRDDARFTVAPARLVRGVLAAAPADTGGVRMAYHVSLAPLERLLRGDLEPLPGASALAGARLEADTALPGWGLVEEALAEGAPAGVPPSARLSYVDEPAGAPGPSGTTPLYALRATVVSERSLRAVMASLGPEKFAALLTCANEGAR